MALGDVAANLNVPVFPCGDNKRPITENGFKNAVTDRARIIALFERPGAALIGMPTGEVSGYIVIDIDIRADRSGMEWLNLNADALPETRTHKTRSGGLHLVFRAPEGVTIRNSTNRLAPCVDVRGDGGYVILPPSPGYEIADPTEPAEMPRWLINACCPPVVPQAPPAERKPPRADGGSAYGLAALSKECDAIRSARWGEQESTLNAAALKIGGLIAGGELQEGIAQADLTSAGNEMSSEPNREPWRHEDVREKVRRGIQHGMQTPRVAPPPKPREMEEPPEELDDPGYWAEVDNHHRMSAQAWHDMEQREGGKVIPASEEATAAAGKDVLWLIDTPWTDQDIELRPWIVRGYLMRGAVTVVSGPGSSGKSSLMVAWATCLAIGCQFNRFKLTAPVKVGTYNVEDDAQEQRRRFSAMAKQIRVPVSDFIGNLTILGPSRVGTLLTMTADGRMLVNTPVMDKLETWVAEHKPDVLMLDPFVELHGGEENDNTQIRAVMARFRTMAAEHRMAVVILHHSRKGEATPGDPDSLRGASSIVGAARVVLTLNVMTADEAKELNIPADKRRDYFRLDGAKSNYAPVTEAEWFEREVKILDNGTDAEPGDGVAVAWPWTPPSVWKDMTADAVSLTLDKIAAGPSPGMLYSASSRGANNSRWVGNAVMDMLGVNETQASQVVKAWLQSGLLYPKTYRDAATRKDVQGVCVDRSKQP